MLLCVSESSSAPLPSADRTTGATRASAQISNTILLNFITSGIIFNRRCFGKRKIEVYRKQNPKLTSYGHSVPAKPGTEAEVETPYCPIERIHEAEGTHQAQLSLIWHGIRYTSRMEAIQTLKSYLGSLEIGPPISHQNLTLFPVTDGQSKDLTYLLLEEAMATGKFQITELGFGTVPQLRLVNRTGRMVFLMDGEALVGAKQNRTLNTSILAAAKSNFDIPVSCVEQGRWAFASQEMRRGSITYPDLRKLKHGSVYESLRFGGSYRSDQERIWQSVRGKLASMKVGSATVNMEEAYRAHEKSMEDFTANLAYPAGACGVIAAVEGRVICADLFDSASTLEKLWSRLVFSYAMDALETSWIRRQVSAEASSESSPRPSGRSAAADSRDTPAVTGQQAAGLLRIPDDAEIETFPSPGLGENVRFRHRRLTGHALVYEDLAVHVALFGPEERAAAFRRPIRRPSQRRSS
jgi:hypothetical protein